MFKRGMVRVLHEVFDKAFVQFVPFGYGPERYAGRLHGALIAAHKIYQTDEAFIQHIDFFVSLLHVGSPII